MVREGFGRTAHHSLFRLRDTSRGRVQNAEQHTRATPIDRASRLWQVWMVQRTVRVFSSHAELEAADLQERREMTPVQRLKLGAELHAFWVRNYFPHATRLDRTVRVVHHSQG